MELSGIEMESTWKVMTLFIGSNDICVACHLEMELDGDEFGEYLTAILNKVRDRIPRVLVNVVELFQVSPIYELTENVTYCRHVHSLIFPECFCAFGPTAGYFRQRMDTMVDIYNKKVREVVHGFMQERNDVSCRNGWGQKCDDDDNDDDNVMYHTLLFIIRPLQLRFIPLQEKCTSLTGQSKWSLTLIASIRK